MAGPGHVALRPRQSPSEPSAISAREPDQVAPLRLFQSVVPDHRAGCLQGPEKTAHSGSYRRPPASAAAAGDDPDHRSGTGLGLGAKEPLGVSGRIQYRLSVQVEHHVGRAIGPVQHQGSVWGNTGPVQIGSRHVESSEVVGHQSRRENYPGQRRTRVAWSLLALCLTLLACDPSAEPIRIGLAGSLSDPVGQPMKRAAELAVEQINAAGGIKGRPIELLERDDYADPDSAVFVATDLYEAGVSAVIGHIFSSATLAAAPVYNGGSDPVVAISPSSSSPDISTAGEYTFRICPSDLAHGAALARWVHDTLGLQRGALLFLNDQYGRGVRQMFVREFTRRGGVLLAMDPYLGDTPNVGAYLDRLAKIGGVEFLVIAGNRGEGEEILRQARQRGLRMPVLGGDGLEGIEEAG